MTVQARPLLQRAASLTMSVRQKSLITDPESPSTRRSAARTPDIPLWMLFPLFFVAVYLSHLTLLRLPYYWDEGGYYIPAAWDLFRTGTLIPQTTLTNAHPPLPSILLASWWHLSGYVVSGTRTLICLVSAAALLAVFRLSRNLAGSTVAVVVTVLTAIYPIWFAQSSLAHADIFAAAFTLWGLSFYLTRDNAANAAAPRSANAAAPESSTDAAQKSSVVGSTFQNRLWAATMFSLAALSKETAIITPLALAAVGGVPTPPRPPQASPRPPRLDRRAQHPGAAARRLVRVSLLEDRLDLR